MRKKLLKLAMVPVFTPPPIAESSDAEEIEPCWAAVGTAAQQFAPQAAYVAAANLFTRMAAEMGIAPDAIGDWARDLTKSHVEDVRLHGHAFAIGIPRPGGSPN